MALSNEYIILDIISYGIQILSTLALLAAAAAAIYYAAQARKQAVETANYVVKTQELIEEAKKQANHTKALVEQGERAFKPSAKVILACSKSRSKRGEYGEGLWVINDHLIFLAVVLKNLSKGYSKFNVLTAARFEIETREGTSGKKRTYNLNNRIDQGYFSGKCRNIIKPREDIQTGFLINFREITEKENIPSRNDFLDLLRRGRIYIQFLIEYANDDIPYTKREPFFDVFKIEPGGTAHELHDGSCILEGYFAFQGRYEETFVNLEGTSWQ